MSGSGPAWERVSECFEEALALPESARAAWLDALRAREPAVADEVGSLLGFHDGAAVLDEVPEALIADALGPWGDAPTLIGSFRVLRTLGTGGMGAVYLGERADADFQQRVALKLVRRGFDSPALRERFLRERRILARLEHPNIARLVDGGLTDDGLPFFAMEYVDGVPLHRFADDRRLSIETRLELFAQVCDAVDHAHRQLVVHRDLKPANVFVTEDGTIKLLDFGVAKLLEESAADEQPGTRYTERWLTPEYASPEQIRGEPVTTACDVYALGVLLYELLSGHRPYGGQDTPPHLLGQAILEQDPVRPSTAISRGPRAAETGGDSPTTTVSAETVGQARGLAPDRLRKRLAGDLDTIVLKAMQKEPARRYAGAAELAADVRNHLVGRPVSARPDSLAYRWGRFVRRNRTAVALAALALVSLVGGLVGTASQARRARVEARAAEAERDRVARVAGLLVDMFRLGDPASAEGQDVTAREVLDRGAERITAEFADEPALQADLLSEVARIYDNLGLFDAAAGHLERVVEIRTRLFGDAHPSVAESRVELSHARVEQGRADEGLALADSGVAVLRASVGAGGSVRDLALALMQKGVAESVVGRPTEAATSLAEATRLLQQEGGDDDEALARALYLWADAAHSSGDFEAADSLFEAAVARYRSRAGVPSVELATSLNSLANIRLYRGQLGEGAALMEQALDVARTVYGPMHPAVAEGLVGLTNARALQGRFAEARASGEEAVRVAEVVWGPDHMSTANARLVLGTTLLQGSSAAEALPVLEGAARVLARELGPGNARTIANEVTVAQALRSAGERARARARFERTLEASDAGLGVEHPYHAFLLLELGRMDFEDGAVESARTRAEAAFDLASRALRPDHRFAVWASRLLARARMEQGDLPGADSLLAGVIAAQVEAGPAEARELVTSRVVRADLALRQGRVDEAERWVDEAFAGMDETRGPTSAVRLEAEAVRGAVLAARGRTEEARALLAPAAEGLRRALGPASPQARTAAARLAALR
ncbi:MAG: tetratricopeptide repeat protein [Gemmatimonadota bacterium]|nr:tetratricopeptide repeat protein [Gemmatimonadota bacterium]